MTRVAAAQLPLRVGEPEANRAVAAAAAAGARLVVLPELVNSGYVFTGADEAKPQRCRMTRHGLNPRPSGRGARQDLEFPERVRVVGLAGADLLAVSTNWPASFVPAGERPVLIAHAQVAAAANRMYVAVADRCAAERGVGWVCGTSLIGPDGNPLAGPVLRDGPAVLVADCDLAAAGTRRSARATTFTTTGGRTCTRSPAHRRLRDDRPTDRAGSPPVAAASVWPTI